MDNEISLDKNIERKREHEHEHRQPTNIFTRKWEHLIRSADLQTTFFF